MLGIYFPLILIILYVPDHRVLSKFFPPRLRVSAVKISKSSCARYTRRGRVVMITPARMMAAAHNARRPSGSFNNRWPSSTAITGFT